MAGTATGQSSYSSTGGTTYFDLTKATGDRAEINDALFFQNKPDSSSGTGLIQAIVRVQDPGGGDGLENGYNSSARPVSYEENTSPNFTTSLLLSEVPIVTIDGTQYYEFRLDINQLNNLSLLSLDEIKVYTSAVADGEATGLITGSWFTNNADLVYDMDGAGNTSVLLDAGNSSGSGSSDMFFYVPLANFGAVDPDDTYVTLYSEFGGATTLDGSDGLTPLDDPANSALGDNGSDTGDVATAIYGSYLANDGFEEWSVSKQTGGNITGYKFDDANGNGQWDVGEVALGGWSFDYTITYDEGKGHNIQHVVVDGTVTTSDGAHDVDGDGIIDPVGYYSIAVPVSSDKNETYTITITEHSQTGWVNTYDGDATANGTTTFNFSGNNLTTTGSPAISGAFGATHVMNFGNFETFTISGTKYEDVNGNSAVDSGDNGLANWVVWIDKDNDGKIAGDTNNNGVLDGTEVWTEKYAITDSSGNWSISGLDASYDNAPVKEFLQDGWVQTLSPSGTIDATSGNDQTGFDFANFLADPSISITKYVKTDVSGAFVDANDPDGPLASASTTVDFKVVVTNDGNEALSGISISDTVDHNGVETNEVIDYNLIGAQLDFNNDGVGDALWSDYDEDQDGTLDDADGDFSTVDDFVLAAGDSFTVLYSLDSALGQHENTAAVEATSAISNTIVNDDDDANYYVLESEECVGVRTPGFWANTKWGTFWDGVGNNQPAQAGSPGFAAGELVYAVDSDGDGVVNPMDTNGDGYINGAPGDKVNDNRPIDTSVGLLIGDYNKNGITDAGEDTVFISLADAKKLINASSKQLVDGKTADGIYMLGRDVVAAWLNYLANNPDDTTGNCIGTVDPNDGKVSPREYLDAAIDWLQQFASTGNADDTLITTDTNLNTSFHDGDAWAKFEFDSRVAPSSGSWQNPVTVGEDIPYSAAAMHSAIDGYNNTGKIGVVEYCCDADSPVVINVLSQVQDSLL